MALIYARLLCKSNLHQHRLRYFYTSKFSNVHMSAPTLCPSPSLINETYNEKNKRLGRPMSPHLTIYKFQLPMTLSLTHRTTGIMLSSYIMILGVGTLFYPEGIPGLVQDIANYNLPPALILSGKLLLAYPLMFHYFCGIRHLIWDFGKYLSMKEVYATGWTVVGLSVISSLILALL